MSETDLWYRAVEVFERVMRLPPGERTMALDVECAGDGALRASVRRLLEAQGHPGSATGADMAAAQPLAEPGVDSGRLAAGSCVGPFRIAHVLGQGGMGLVYLAERDIDGRVQRVALKLPRTGSSPQFLERFRRERAILAQLDHPGIARLIDAGELADGRLYLAMEYVEGRSLLEHCAQAKLDPGARIRLVIGVLEALQHAHERLVLHRDIKSANVLVDGAGQPRLLDFGVGKDLGDGHAPSTADGQRFFTLGSAASEQVLGAPSSAATDVYAVGVLLYRLLTGRAPLELDELSAHESLQCLLNQVPPLASVAVNGLQPERRANGARERGLRPAAWAAALRGDLDLILARALRKEPAARYPTAAAFAEDLRAVLELRPIAARSSERWYRASRFLRRHALAVGLTATLLLSLAGFVGFILLQSAQLRVARDEAEQGRSQAEQVTAFLKGLFRQSDPTVARGREIGAREMLERGVTDLGMAKLDDGVRAELLEALAGIFHSLGDLERAYALAMQALGLRPATSDARARSLEQVTSLELARGQVESAQAHVEELLRDVPPQPSSAHTEVELRRLALRANVRTNAGGNSEEGIAFFQALADEYQRRFGRSHPSTRAALGGLATHLGRARRHDEERALLEELTRDLDLSALKGDGDDVGLARLARYRSTVLRDQGRFDEARELLLWSGRTVRKVYGERHQEYIVVLMQLSSLEKKAGRLDLAEDYQRDAVRIGRLALAPESDLLAAQHFNLGVLLMDARGDTAAAIPYLREAVYGLASAGTESVNLSVFRLLYAEALMDTGQPALARQELLALQALLDRLRAEMPAVRARIEIYLQCLLPASGRSAGYRAQVDAAILLHRTRKVGDETVYRRMQLCRDSQAMADRQ